MGMMSIQESFSSILIFIVQVRYMTLIPPVLSLETFRLAYFGAIF